MPKYTVIVAISFVSAFAAIWVANNVDAVKKLTGTTNKYF